MRPLFSEGEMIWAVGLTVLGAVLGVSAMGLVGAWAQDDFTRRGAGTAILVAIGLGAASALAWAAAGWVLAGSLG